MKKQLASTPKVQPERDENTVEMFPELLASLPPAKPLPKTDAERQKASRDRKRLLRESAGLREVSLLGVERDILVDALELWHAAGDTDTTPEFRLQLLQKLSPGATWTSSYQQFAEKSWKNCLSPLGTDGYDAQCDDELPEFPVKLSRFDFGLLFAAVSSHTTAQGDRWRDSPLVWDSLGRIFGSMPGFNKKLLNQLGRDPGELKRSKEHSREKSRSAELQAQAEHYQAQRDGFIRENERLMGCMAELQELAESLSGPPMKMERDPVSQRELRQRIDGLERENAAVVAERGRAFDAVAVLTDRLRRVGLSTDYRRQVGE